MTRRTAQELKDLRERIAALERAGLKASAQALRDKLPRERVLQSGRRVGKTMREQIVNETILIVRKPRHAP